MYTFSSLPRNIFKGTRELRRDQTDDETRHHPANERAADVLELARGRLGDHIGGASEDKESAERGHVDRKRRAELNECVRPKG
jgi:hypothetical protein